MDLWNIVQVSVPMEWFRWLHRGIPAVTCVRNSVGKFDHHGMFSLPIRVVRAAEDRELRELSTRIRIKPDAAARTQQQLKDSIDNGTTMQLVEVFGAHESGA